MENGYNMAGMENREDGDECFTLPITVLDARRARSSVVSQLRISQLARITSASRFSSALDARLL